MRLLNIVTRESSKLERDMAQMRRSAMLGPSHGFDGWKTAAAKKPDSNITVDELHSIPKLMRADSVSSYPRCIE